MKNELIDSKRSQQQKQALKICLIAFVSFIVVLFFSSKLISPEVRSQFQKRILPAHMFSVGFMGDILRELNLLEPKLMAGEHELALPVVNKQARLSFWVTSSEAINGEVLYETVDIEKGIEALPQHVTFTHSKGRGVVSMYLDDIHNLAKILISVTPGSAQVKLENITLAQDGVLDYALTQDNVPPKNGKAVHSVNTGPVSFDVDKDRIIDNEYSHLFKRKRLWSPYNLVVSNSTKMRDSAGEGYRHAGIPTINVHTDVANISGEHGVKTNYKLHGRGYERLATMSFYDAAGRHVVTSPVGLRYHGGVKRGTYHSYKVYFREEYGSTEYKHRYIFDNPLPMNSFVIHHTNFPEFSSVSHLLAMDIVESIGGVIPRRKPVIFNLNGAYQGLYYITDHLSERNFADWLGTDNFHFYRYKSVVDSESQYALAVTVGDLKKLPHDQVMDYVAQRWALESFTQIMIANTYLNNYDYCQGVLYRELDNEDSRWKTVGWDFDGAFTIDDKDGAWTMYSWLKWENGGTMVSRLDEDLRRCSSITVFRLLLNTQSEYREYFYEKLTEALNGPLAPDVLIERLDQYYEKYKSVPGIQLQAYEEMKEYFQKRGDFVLENVQKKLSILHNNDPEISTGCSFFPESESVSNLLSEKDVERVYSRFLPGNESPR